MCTDEWNLNHYVNSINKFPLLKQDEEKELSKKILAGDDHACQRLISCNLRLVVKISHGYSQKEQLLQDFIQEGNIGLITAAVKFDYKKKVRFSTYATWWIKQHITSFIINSKMIRLPVLKELKLRRIIIFIDEFQTEHNRHPSIDEIADHFSVTKKEVMSFWNFHYKYRVSSLSNLSDEKHEVLDFISDKKYNPEKQLMKDELIMELEKSLSQLDAREQTILRKHYAFDGTKKLTFKELAKELNVSSETVRLIEKKALKKLSLHRDDLKVLFYDIYH